MVDDSEPYPEASLWAWSESFRVGS